MFFYHTFYKTWAILTKFGTSRPEEICYTVTQAFSTSPK